MLAEKGDEAVLDAGLIAAAQKVEHYEIASYGTLVAYARTLGLTKVADSSQRRSRRRSRPTSACRGWPKPDRIAGGDAAAEAVVRGAPARPVHSDQCLVVDRSGPYLELGGVMCPRASRASP